MIAILTALLVVVVPMIGLSALHVALPVVAPALMTDAGLPPEAFGWVGGASGLGSVWFYMANHAVTPTLGPVRTLQAGSLFAVAGVLLVLSGSFPLIMAGAFLVGFGYSTCVPAGSQILADQTPRERWGTLFSLRQAGVPLGGVIAGVVGGAMLASHGWRPALVVISGVCAVLGLLLLLVPRRFNESRPRPPFRWHALFSPSNVTRPFQALQIAPGLARMAVVCVGFAVVQSATMQFFVTYLVTTLGYGVGLAGALFATVQAASVGGRVVLGFVADRLGSPRPVLKLLSVTSAFSALLLAWLAPGWPSAWLFAVAAIVGSSIATWNGLYLAEVASLAPADGVSEATAGTTFFVFLTYAVTPPVFGALIGAWGYGAAYSLAAVAALLAGVTLALENVPVKQT